MRAASVGSGLYPRSADDFRWESNRRWGASCGDEALKPGEDRTRSDRDRPAPCIAKAWAWHRRSATSGVNVVHVAETTASMDRQVSASGARCGPPRRGRRADVPCRRWCCAGLAPLRRGGRMEKAAGSERLSGTYPQEVSLLTDSLNA